MLRIAPWSIPSGHVRRSPAMRPVARSTILSTFLESTRTAVTRLRRGRRRRDEAREVERLLHEHGASSIAWFALDADTDYFWGPDHRAVLAYRPESDALLVVGDPIGPWDALRSLLEEFESFCRSKHQPFAF